MFLMSPTINPQNLSTTPNVCILYVYYSFINNDVWKTTLFTGVGIIVYLTIPKSNYHVFLNTVIRPTTILQETSLDPNETRRRVSQVEDAVRSQAEPPGAIFETIQALLFTATQEERIRLLHQLAIVHETAYGNLEAAINTLGDAYKLTISSCISEQQLQVGCELVRLHRRSGEPLALQRADDLAKELNVLCGMMERSIATTRRLLSK